MTYNITRWGKYHEKLAKEHLKKKITRNNEKLNELHTTSIDSLIDDDGQSGTVGQVNVVVSEEVVDE